MKKPIALLVSAFLSVSLLAGCAPAPSESSAPIEEQSTESAEVSAVASADETAEPIVDQQLPAEQWIAVFDGEAKKDDKFLNVIEDNNGAYVAVGMSETDQKDINGNSTYNGVIAKYNSEGKEEWSSTVPNTKLESILATDAGYLAVGVTTSYEAPFEGQRKSTPPAAPAANESTDADQEAEPVAIDSDAAAILFDLDGNIVWARAIGGTEYDSFASGDWSSINDPIQLENGNFLIAGQTSSTDGDFADKNVIETSVFLAEINATGEVVSLDTIASSAPTSPYSLIALKDGGFALAGTIRGIWDAEKQEASPVVIDGVFADASHSDWDEAYAFIIKLDSGKNIVWTKLLESHGAYNMTLAQAADGSFILGGDGFEMLQADASETTAEPSAEESAAADTEAEEEHPSGLAIYKLDSEGNVLWFNEYKSGKSLYATSLSLAADGTILASGEDYYDSTLSEGEDGIRGWFGMIDQDGNLINSRTYGTSDFEVLFQIRPASDGGYIGAGEQASEKGDWDASIIKYAPFTK